MFYDRGVENGLLNDYLLNVLRIKTTFREKVENRGYTKTVDNVV